MYWFSSPFDQELFSPTTRKQDDHLPSETEMSQQHYRGIYKFPDLKSLPALQQDVHLLQDIQNFSC